MKSSYTPLILVGLCLSILVACSPDRSALNWLHKTERDWAKLEKKQPEWPEMLDSAGLHSRLNFLAEALSKTQEWEKKSAGCSRQNQVDSFRYGLRSCPKSPENTTK